MEFDPLSGLFILGGGFVLALAFSLAPYFLRWFSLAIVGRTHWILTILSYRLAVSLLNFGGYNEVRYYRIRRKFDQERDRLAREKGKP